MVSNGSHSPQEGKKLAISDMSLDELVNMALGDDDR